MWLDVNAPMEITIHLDGWIWAFLIVALICVMGCLLELASEARRNTDWWDKSDQRDNDEKRFAALIDSKIAESKGKADEVKN